MNMRKVREGDTITIDGVTYRFGPTSAQAYNDWLGLLERGFSPEKDVGKIHVRSANGSSGDLFSPQEIREVLDE